MSTSPSVLWVTIESLRADHTPMHGYRRDTTPSLRREATRQDATVVSPTIAQSMWTPAASTSMLTGTYLSTHQVGQEGTPPTPVPSDLRTLPERLRTEGYRTGLFSGNDYVGSTTGLDAGFETVEELILDTDDFLPWRGSVAVDNWRSAFARLAETREPRIDRLKTDVSHNTTGIAPARFRRWLADGDEPFFAYVHLQSPHHPYLPPADVRDAFTDEIELPTDEAYRLVETVYDGAEALRRRMAEGLDLSDEQLAAVEAMYDAEILFADRIAGELIAAAREAADDLVVVCTGDHGELFGERELLGHNLLLHDALVSVPLVVSGIDGVVETGVTQHIDVTATVASVADCDVDGLEGRDLRDDDRTFALTQRGRVPIEEYERHDPSFSPARVSPEPTSAVRTTQFKCLTVGNEEWLYALPDETTDVSDAHPETTAQLRETLALVPTEWTPVSDEVAAFDDATRERLRDLGYLA